MSPAQTTTSQARAAAVWFLESGIQDVHGGVARYYRADLGRNLRVSTEITGYSVSALMYLFQRTGDERCLHAANKSADFLISDAWDPALRIFPFEHPANQDTPESLAYFFDSGIIVRGLLAAWRATKSEPYLNGAIAAGDSMGQHFRTGAEINPILRLPSLDPLPWTAQWSRGPGCYQLKSALGWYDLYTATGEVRFLEWYEQALESALRSHGSFLPAETPEKTMDRLHAYSYFLEGVMPAADRPQVRAALREGICRATGFLCEIAAQFERSDVHAQLLRVRMFADQLADLPVNRAEAEREVARIPGFQVDDSDPRLAGGYAFGKRTGELIRHINPVSTAFCSQALEMWADYEAGLPLSLESLI